MPGARNKVLVGAWGSKRGVDGGWSLETRCWWVLAVRKGVLGVRKGALCLKCASGRLKRARGRFCGFEKEWLVAGNRLKWVLVGQSRYWWVDCGGVGLKRGAGALKGVSGVRKGVLRA